MSVCALNSASLKHETATAGLRMRLPTSLLFGLMWFDPDRPDAIHNIRHEAQDRDGNQIQTSLQLARLLTWQGMPLRASAALASAGLRKYGWEAHDGATFGRQELYDGPVQLTTNWTKRMSAGSAAGDWALRLSARQAPQLQQQLLLLVFWPAAAGICSSMCPCKAMSPHNPVSYQLITQFSQH